MLIEAGNILHVILIRDKQLLTIKTNYDRNDIYSGNSFFECLC